MSITHETRRESYDLILEDLGKRQKSVYDCLSEWGEATAGELAWFMYQRGLIPTSDINNVHPRLNELEKAEFIEIVGKRKCEVSKKKCAVYRIKLSMDI